MNAQQLKNSILQEAIEGRLVPQDPNEEPASVLLERIRKEKARMVKEGKLKKKDLEETPISEDEIPFKIPKSWEWRRMQDVIEFVNGRAYKKEELLDSGKYKVLRVGNFFTNDSWYYSDLELPDDKYCYKGDLLYAWSASFGPKIWERDKTIFHYHIWNVKYDNRIFFREYLYYFFLIDKVNIKSSTTGSTMIHVSMENMKPRCIPIPPLAEQKRIVKKIEELLPKVEEYGKAQESLDKLNEELPERLKKSILQEAIEGRLVPQDPNDEPASVLLEKIRKEKARLVKEGKLKKKDLVEVPIKEDEIPFKIPESWEWTPLGDHISAMSGLAYKKDDLTSYSNEYVRVLRGGNISFGSWSIKDDDVMIGKQFVNDELILKKGMFISPAVTSLEHMGKTALIREDQNNVVAGGFVLMLLPHYKNEQYWEYLNVLFQSGYYKEKCKSITNKSGQAFFNLSRAKLLNLLIPLPPLAEQKRIVAKVEKLLHEIDKLKV